MKDQFSAVAPIKARSSKISGVPSDADIVTTGAPDIPDVYKWSVDQAAHIRAGRFDKIDRRNAADEIEDVGKREYDALVSNLEVILAHMLKWDFQTEKRSRSWAQSIIEHRGRIDYRFKHSPSLRAKRLDLVEDAYKFARRRASRETKRDPAAFPATCAYSWSDIMERPFDYAPD